MLPLTVILVLAAPVPKAKAAGVDLRDADGAVLVSAADITHYDWDTHTLTVAKAVKSTVELANPTEFTVCLDGKPVYRGKFWRARADEPCPGPVILLGDTPADQIRIDFNYGGADPTADEDVRRDSALRDSLGKVGKLSEKK